MNDLTQGVALIRGIAALAGWRRCDALVRPSVRFARIDLGDSYTMMLALADDMDEARSGLAEMAQSSTEGTDANG